MIHSEEISYVEVKVSLLFISLVAILLQYKNFSYLLANDLFAERLVLNQGKGYLLFLNFSSYFIVFYGIKQYLAGEIDLKRLLLHPIPALIIFSLKLQRGHAIYPLVFVFLAFIYKKLNKRTANLLTLVVIVSMFYVADITSVIRTAVVTKSESVEFDISNENVIPMSFSHAELLSAIISDSSINNMPSTLWGSFVNWIPAFLFHNKPSTTGPILNWKYGQEGGFMNLRAHRSSYTTDLLIEGYYNFGYFGIFLFGFIYSIIIGLVWNSICRSTTYSFIRFPLSLFVFAFTIFFSDLGNFFGVVVIFYIEFIFIRFYASIINKRR